MRGVPDRKGANGVDTGQVETRHERRAEEWRRGQERHGVEPRVTLEQARTRGEIENRHGDGRERQRAGDPGEDGEHRLHERNPRLGSEQRAAAADGAEGERQHAEPGGEVVAPHQEEEQGRTSEDRLSGRSCPGGVVPIRRCPSPRPTAGRASLRCVTPSGESTSQLTASANAHPVQVAPDLDPSGLAREPRVEDHAARAGSSTRCWAWSRLPGRNPAAAAGLPGATRMISGGAVKSDSTSGGRALSGRWAVGSPASVAPAPAGHRYGRTSRT